MNDTYIEKKAIARFFTIDDTLADGTRIVSEAYEDANGELVSDNVRTQNKSFKRPDTGLWFEIFYMSARPYQQEFGTAGRNRWTGIVQININYPLDSGTYDVDLAYSAIASKFKRGDIFDGVKVLQTASRTSALPHDDYYSVPVTIQCQAYLTN